MKRLLVSLGLALAAVAFAGQQGKDSLGSPPSVASPGTLGVSLANAVGCRCSMRVDGGTSPKGNDGITASGHIVPYYYDPATGWIEGHPSSRCAIVAKIDGGLLTSFICPDYEPLAAFGRVFCTAYGFVAYVDAGTGAAWTEDGGASQPMIRTECWGPNLSANP